MFSVLVPGLLFYFLFPVMFGTFNSFLDRSLIVISQVCLLVCLLLLWLHPKSHTLGEKRVYLNPQYHKRVDKK